MYTENCGWVSSHVSSPQHMTKRHFLSQFSFKLHFVFPIGIFFTFKVFTFWKSVKLSLSFTQMSALISSQDKFQERQQFDTGFAFLYIDFTDDNETFKDDFGH